MGDNARDSIIEYSIEFEKVVRDYFDWYYQRKHSIEEISYAMIYQGVPEKLVQKVKKEFLEEKKRKKKRAALVVFQIVLVILLVLFIIGFLFLQRAEIGYSCMTDAECPSEYFCVDSLCIQSISRDGCGLYNFDDKYEYYKCEIE